MERNRNWVSWAALILAGLALLVAISSHHAAHRNRMAFVQSLAAVSLAPGFPNASDVRAPNPPEMPGFSSANADAMRGHADWMRGHADQMRGHADGMRGHADGMRAMGHGAAGFQRHGMGIFGLISGLGKLVALGMLAWLLLRLFQQRRQAPPAAPVTPAGHDPRVE